MIDYNKLFGFSVLLLTISFVAALNMDKSLHKKFPEVKTYVWGYFIGWAGTLGGIGFHIITIIAAPKTYNNPSDMFIVLCVVSVISAFAHFFIIQRNKWGWIVGTILQLNPVLWLINGIYLKNRWAEMDALPANKFQSIPVAIRALIVAPIFWAIVVLAYVFVFEPYGGHISDKEWRQVAKIVIFPIVTAVVGYFLYAKVIKPES